MYFIGHIFIHHISVLLKYYSQNLYVTTWLMEKIKDVLNISVFTTEI